jgi:hypothetical protein
MLRLGQFNGGFGLLMKLAWTRRWMVGWFLLPALLVPSAPLLAEPRLALVIANQNYTQSGARLSNTFRDGDLVKAALETVGFKVTLVHDTASEGALLKAIGEHVQRLADAGPDAVGFLYYSGHGAADRPDGANYLIPTEAPLTHAAQLPLMAVRLDKITATLAGAGKINFVVFDACRNVPLQRTEKDMSFKGWAPVREQRGLLVAYATEPGNIAVDQSVYARALAEEIVKPGLEASQAFRAVTRRVLKETQDKQLPEYLDKRLYDFYFAASEPITPPKPIPQIKPDEPTVATKSFDGTWAFTVVSNKRCLTPTWQSSIIVEGSRITSRARPPGTLSSDGTFKFYHPHSQKPDVLGVFEGKLDGKSGRGTFHYGGGCSGTITLELL